MCRFDELQLTLRRKGLGVLREVERPTGRDVTSGVLLEKHVPMPRHRPVNSLGGEVPLVNEE